MAGAGRTRTPVPECAGIRHAFSLVGELALGGDRSLFVGDAAAGVPAGRARGVAARRRRRPFVQSRRGGAPFRLPAVRGGGGPPRPPPGGAAPRRAAPPPPPPSVTAQ